MRSSKKLQLIDFFQKVRERFFFCLIRLLSFLDLNLIFKIKFIRSCVYFRNIFLYFVKLLTKYDKIIMKPIKHGKCRNDETAIENIRIVNLSQTNIIFYK